MFLWNKAKRHRSRKKHKKALESNNPNFILRTKPTFDDTITVPGKQLFRKQVPKVTLKNELGEVESQGSNGPIKISLLTLDRKHKNPRLCPLCKKSLTTWFSQCVNCRSCDLRTCRSCADYNLVVGEWTCQKCVHRQNNKDSKSSAGSLNRSSSKFWYDDIIPKRKSLAEYSVPLDTHVDRTTARRYEQLENFISRYLNITPEELNTTDIGKVFKTSRYDLLFARYHEVFSLELIELLRFLKSADEVKEAVSLKKLKELIDKVRVAAKMESAMDMNPDRTTKKDGNRSYTPTYTDILSTAILNRIIIDAQSTKQSKCSVSPVSNDSAVLVDYCSTSTELPESGSEKDTHNWVLTTNNNAEGNSGANRTSDDESTTTDTPCGGSLGSNWSNENIAPHPLKIEESIEEITTTTYESDDSSSHSSNSKSSHSHSDEEESQEPMSPRSSIHEKIANWEHNWLFKRKKEVLKKRERLLQDPVVMLVPNPTEDVEVMIGDEKASDLDDDFEDLDVSQLGYVVVNAGEWELTNVPENSENSGPLIAPDALAKETPVAPTRSPVPTPRITSQSTSPTIEKITSEIKFEEVKSKPQPAPRDRKSPVLEEVTQEPERSPQVSHVENNVREQCDNEVVVTAEADPPLHNEIDNKKALKQNSSSSSSSDSDSDEPKNLPPMRIAEREKEKWNHPVAVKYNPYAVENLNKRLKENEFIPLPSTKNREELGKIDDFPVEKRNIDKFRRDYYVNNSSSDERKPSTSSSSDGDFHKVKMEMLPPVKVKEIETNTTSPPSPKPKPIVTQSIIPDSGSNMEEIKLPSVRNLAKKFSSPAPETKPKPKEVTKPSSWKPIVTTNPPLKQQLRERLSSSSSESSVESVVSSDIGLTQAAKLQFEVMPTPSVTTQSSLAGSLTSFDEPFENITNVKPHIQFFTYPAPGSVYNTFSRAQSEPPMRRIVVPPEEMPCKSTREMVKEIEQRARQANSVPYFPIRRSKSEASKPPQRIGAMTFLAEQSRNNAVLGLDPELEGLKSDIVLGSRSRRGQSIDGLVEDAPKYSNKSSSSSSSSSDSDSENKK